MKTSKLYKEERAEVIEKMEGLVASADGRDLSSDEQSNFDSLNEKVEELNKMAVRAESFEKLQATKAVKEITENTPSEMRDYSFQDAMNQAATGRLEGLVKEMDQEARNEARYTGQSFKGIAIPSSILTRAAVATAAGNATEVMAWTDQLEANLVLASAGANFYSGVDNMKFPVFSSIASNFVPETGGTQVDPVTGTATSVTLEPKKLISIVNVSAEAIAQNASIEAALRRNMAQSVASTLEAALLGIADVTNAPTSIFADAPAEYDDVFNTARAVGMETFVLNSGVQLEGARMAYLVNTNAYAAAKAEAQVASVSPLYDTRDKTINGYFSFVSSNVGNGSGATKDTALFGDFSKVHIAQFGGLDVIYDIYTNAGTGEPRYILTSLVDGDAVQNQTAFISLLEA